MTRPADLSEEPIGSATGEARHAVIGAAVLVVAFGAVVAFALVVAGRGRDDFGHGTVDRLTQAMTAHGLTICAASAPESDTDEGGAISTRSVDVGLPGGCADAVTVQIDAYDDRAHRDAAAREAEGRLRPRTAGTVFTWKQYTLYLQGDDASADAAVRDRIVDALDSVGAR